MLNAINWFEIPALDIDRAQIFYEEIFNRKLKRLHIDDLPMVMFDVDGVGGALIQQPDYYVPSHQGPLLYLNANPNMDEVLARVGPAGGKILIQRRQISDDNGFMAVIEDTEGNRIALHADQ